ncbi:MAG: hypothetical protein WA851_26430 [Xanthobacteraceae bacterium]
MLKSIFIGLSIREDSGPFALALVVGLIVPSRFFGPITFLQPLVVVARLD